MTTLDLTPIIQPVLSAAVTIITTVVAYYVPKAIAAFETRTGIILTENQRKTVVDAVQTAAGMVETQLDKGAARVEHVTTNNPLITDQAQAVINAVPTAAGALGLTVDSVSRMIVGAVDTAAHGAPAAVPAASAPQA